MQRRTNRRDFLAYSSAAMAASFARGARGVAGANRRVVLGVMGLSRGKAVASTFARLPDCEIKFVCDVDSKRAASCAEAVSKLGGSPTAVGDFRRILDDKDVDALVCAAPNHWHAPATILACQAGKHVYVEKPCSHTPAEGEWMVEAANKHRRVIQVGTQRRSQPEMIEVFNLLRENVIGRVYHARAAYANTRGSIGKGKPAPIPEWLDYDLWQGPAPRRPYVDNLVHYEWHWRWHWGNGELGNNGVHALDLCRAGMQVDFPIRVVSSGGRYCFDDDQETPDTHVVSFEFEGRRSIQWECTSCNGQPNGFVTFFGERGAIAVNGDCGYVLYDLNGKAIKKADAKLKDSHHAENFLAAIRHDKPEICNAGVSDGHRAALLCHLGNIAHRTGDSLRCDPANGRIVDNPAAQALWTKAYDPKWKPAI